MTLVDETVLRVSHEAAVRLMGTGTPLQTILIVPVWLDAHGAYRSAPVVLGDPESFEYLASTLRLLIAKLEAGEYKSIPVITQNAPGGEG